MRSLTPKEKAEELVDRFKSRHHALICVEDRIELIKELQISDLMKYDLVEYEIMTQREIDKL